MSEEKIFFEIDKGENSKIRLTKSQFREADYYHLREYYAQDGTFYPTKKGVALNKEQFYSLLVKLRKLRVEEV